MLINHEANLFEHVLWHCQSVYDLNTPQEAVLVARRDGFLDWDNKLTPIGKHVAEFMLQDFENYKSLFEVDVKKTPDFFDQQATHQLQL